MSNATQVVLLTRNVIILTIFMGVREGDGTNRIDSLDFGREKRALRILSLFTEKCLKERFSYEISAKIYDRAERAQR
jgi:hypothetical protein